MAGTGASQLLESCSGVLDAFSQLLRQGKMQGVSPPTLCPESCCISADAHLLRVLRSTATVTFGSVPAGAPERRAQLHYPRVALVPPQGGSLHFWRKGQGKEPGVPFSRFSLLHSRCWWTQIDGRRCRPLTTLPRPGSWWSSCGSRPGSRG